MITAQEWLVTLSLECDTCRAGIVVSGSSIPEVYDAAEHVGWQVRVKVGRHYCSACEVPQGSGRGTTITQDAQGRTVIRG